jgi:carboxyl-terminal processing protease
MWLLRVCIATAALLASLQSDAPAPPNEIAAAYFERAAALIRQHHRNSGKVNWTEILAVVRPMLAGADNPVDTYPAIRTVLTALGERHSFLVAPSSIQAREVTPISNPSAAPDAASPTRILVNGNIGVLRLPALNTLGSQGATLGTAYTSAARASLSDLDKSDLCGWIVDLRDNGGGNMWPMLNGLDPLLGAAPFGFFVRTDGSTQTWLRSGGNVFPAAEGGPQASPAFALRHASAPLAVLIGPRTGSSGEMVAIALIGRQGVRVFGNNSAGLTTGNKVYPLTDGAALVITEVSVRDRTGKDYSGPILPDEPVASARAESAAMQWLAQRCKGSGPRH